MSSLSVTFNKCVDAARVLYPEETRNVTFIDTAEPKAKEAIMNWLAGCDPAINHVFAKHKMTPDDFADECLITTGRAFGDIGGKRKLIVINTIKAATDYAGEPARNIKSVFLHELGHTVVEDALKISGKEEKLDPHQREICADIFMSLHLMRGGDMNKNDIAQILAGRASETWDTSIEHMTAKDLAQLFVSKDAADCFSLSPQDIKKIAHKYAAERHESPKDYVDLRNVFYDCAPCLSDNLQDTLKKLADICEKHDAGSLPFYTAAAILKHSFDTRQDMNGAEWSKTRQIITEKSRETGMEKILAPAAPKKPEVKIINTGLQSSWGNG